MKIDSTVFPNGLSFLNMFMGFLAIITALLPKTGDWAEMNYLPVMFIMAAGIFDMVDGRVARAIKRENPLGVDLDSFADLVTFGVAPAIYFFSQFFVAGTPYYQQFFAQGQPLDGQFYLFFYLGAAVAFLYTLCACVRLAKFNNLEIQGFSGFPSPLAGGFIVMSIGIYEVPTLLFDVIFKHTNVAIYEKYIAFQTALTLPWWLAIFFLLVFAFLMVSRLEFKKPRWFLSFGKSIPKPLLILNIIMVLGIVFLLHYFLLLMTLVYLIPSLIRFRFIDKDLVTFEHKIKGEG